ASSGQGTVTLQNGAVVGRLGTLAGGASTTVTIKTRVSRTGSLFNSANVTANEADPVTGNNSTSVTVTANAPGTFLFPQSVLTVGEGESAATIIVQQINKSDDPTSVHFATTDSNAVTNQDYTASSGQLDFADGQTTATLTVPILQDTL